MKKLLMFVAVAAVAVASQASSLDWSLAAKSWTMSDGSTKPLGVNVYLFDTGATGYSDFVTALTGGTLGDSISASTLTSAAGYIDSAASWNASTKTAQINLNYGKVEKTSDVTSAGEMSVAVIILDGQKYLISDTVSGMAYDDPEDSWKATFIGDSMSKNGWATYTSAGGGGGGDVPEPTSGLLLVLGGAMLALRRRRA